MTVISRGWNRLTLPGKFLFILVPLLVVATAALIILITAFGQLALDTLAANLPIVRFVVAATVILLMTIPTAFLIIYMEMKIIALMNLRIGPGPGGAVRVAPVRGPRAQGPHEGGLHPDRCRLGGLHVGAGGRLSGERHVAAGHPVRAGPVRRGPEPRRCCTSSRSAGSSVVGLLMAGWSSYNKYSLLGGLRAAAQVVSYEIPLTLSVVGLLLLAGTMSLNQLVENQQGWFTDWYIFQQPLGALIFFIAATAEANRTPFDLTEADSEIVAGFATEYSGMRFGFFFFAEYVNVFIVSALFVTLFLGGWNAPFAIPEAWQVQLSLDPASFNIGLLFIIALAPVVLTLLFAAPFWLVSSRIKWWQALLIGFVLANVFIVTLAVAWAYIGLNWVAGILWFMLKTYVLVFTFVWMRGTLPARRIDQLMGFAWKWLLPGVAAEPVRHGGRHRRDRAIGG